MWRRLTVVVAVIMLAAACGGGDGAADDAPANDGAVETDSYESTAALARALGCESHQNVPEADRVMLVTDQGSCRVAGEKIYLFIFANNEERDRYVELASMLGYVRLLGDRWVVQASRDILTDLQSDVGGEILPPPKPD